MLDSSQMVTSDPSSGCGFNCLTMQCTVMWHVTNEINVTAFHWISCSWNLFNLLTMLHLWYYIQTDSPGEFFSHLTVVPHPVTTSELATVLYSHRQANHPADIRLSVQHLSFSGFHRSSVQTWRNRAKPFYFFSISTFTSSSTGYEK